MSEPPIQTTTLRPGGGSGEHAGRDALAWSDWDEGGEGRRPPEVPLPPPLPEG